jgi:hypothetical protein
MTNKPTFDRLAAACGGSIRIEKINELRRHFESRPEDFDPALIGEFHQFMSLGAQMFAPVSTEELDELWGD